MQVASHSPARAKSVAANAEAGANVGVGLGSASGPGPHCPEMNNQNGQSLGELLRDDAAFRASEIRQPLLVPVHRFHRERRQADGDVLGALFLWRGVADPLAGVGDDGLSGGDV
jgi:hypothetical protein